MKSTLQLAAWAILLALQIALFSTPALSQTSEILERWRSPEARQFDFWIGTWDVNLRTIQPNGKWQDGQQAKVEVYPILDGKAILELWDAPQIKGFSLRYYDPEKRKWVLYLNWPGGNRSSIGSLEGEFRHGRGEFYSGQGNSLSRYTFCDIGPDSLRWDDGTSSDGGKTWTSNWIMEFSRSGPHAHWPKTGTAAHTFADGNRCTSPPFTAIQRLAGRFEGTLDVGGRPAKAKMNVYRILGGCTLIRFLSIEIGETTYRNFGLISYNNQRQQYEELRLDHRPGSGAEILRGQLKDSILDLRVRSKSNNEERLLRHVWTLPTSSDDSIGIRSMSSKDSGKTWDVAVEGKLTRKK